MKDLLTPQACFVLAVLGALVIARAWPGSLITVAILVMWVFGWMLVMVRWHSEDDDESDEANP